ncbi:MAG: fasciclin domain-containing protein [Pleurocapsa sp. MO_226.B13]|nr:fasciclin domain-containing protein [Pleurocapsa sp. MO_226.B13]
MAQRIVQQLSSVTATSPVSQIRLDCHWWQPEGKLACLRCPQVMTENYSKLPMHLNCVFTLDGGRVDVGTSGQGNENEKSRRMNKKIITVFISVVVGLIGFIALSSDGGSDRANNPVNENNNINLTVVSTEVRETRADTTDGGVYATLSNGETRFIAKSDRISKPIDPSNSDSFQEFVNNSDTYREAVISPEGQFVAVGGTGYETSFVQVYNVRTDTLHDKISGTITGWTDDGLLEIESCDLSGESCVDKISVSAETPWQVREVPGTRTIPRYENSKTYRDNFSESTNFISNIDNAPNLTLFASALRTTGPDAIKGTGLFTVFAPTDEAFNSLAQSEIDSLFEPANRDRLAELVSNHVVAGEYFYSELTNGLSLETVRRDELTFTRKSGTVSIDNLAYIIEADIQSSNGIIQVIDSVLSY